MIIYIPITINSLIQYNIAEYGLSRAMSPLTFLNHQWYTKYHVIDRSLWLIALIKHGFHHITEE